MTEEERQLIRAGVRQAIRTLGENLHSEDDHGYDLYRWLEKQEEKIIQATFDRIAAGRSMLVD